MTARYQTDTAAGLRAWRAWHRTSRGRRVSRATLARYLGVSRQTVEHWEYGRRPIPGWVPAFLVLLEIANGGAAAVALWPDREPGGG